MNKNVYYHQSKDLSVIKLIEQIHLIHRFFYELACMHGKKQQVMDIIIQQKPTKCLITCYNMEPKMTFSNIKRAWTTL